MHVFQTKGDELNMQYGKYCVYKSDQIFMLVNLLPLHVQLMMCIPFDLTA